MQKELLANTTLSHYRIVSKIGEGGMGEVFLAEDTRLRRRVALKVLPESVGADAGRLLRFEREAFAASALNHPNILTIFEFGADDSTHFLAAEFVDGESLRQRISRSTMTVTETLEIVIQIASALQAAHTAGIIHRDIKPDNIMIRADGYVKVLDFGLAKLVERPALAGTSDSSEEATRRQLQTQAGMIMGTVAYMSPEQARGHEVDKQTDIWSLGCVHYEMLTRQQPFRGETITDALANIIHREPVSILTLREDANAELERIIFRSLSKNKTDRYQTAGDLLLDLKQLQKRLEFERGNESPTAIISPKTLSGPVATAPPSTGSHSIAPTKTKLTKLILAALVLVALLTTFLFYRNFSSRRQIETIAVMPFTNESGNADVEYLSDGMTETLIASLSQLPNLSVKARSTVFYYKGKEASPKKIGEELNVQAVLVGRVAQRGNDIKLNLELVNTATQDVIWSEQYNRRQSDLLTLQSEIARDVSSKLQTKLSGAEVEKLTKTYTANPAAYELYLKGKYYANKYTKEGLFQSIDCFNQAIAIDPNYSSAYSGLAYTYVLMDDWFMSPNESAPKAREAARKALEINEADVDAHVVLGMVAHWYDWDWATAEKEFKRSIELNPRNPESYLYYSYLLSPLGRHDEAGAVAHQGLQIDPLSSGSNFGVASTLVINRRWDEAIVHLRKAIELDPNYWFHHSYLGRAYEQKGMMSEAIAEFKLAFELDNLQSENWAGLAHAYAASGRKDEAQKMLDGLIRKPSENTYVSPFSVAIVYAGLGDKGKTFEWLERAYSERSYYLPVYLTTDARLDGLHSDQRFKDLVGRIGLPQ